MKRNELTKRTPFTFPLFPREECLPFSFFSPCTRVFFPSLFPFFCYISRLLQHHPTRLPFSPLAVCFFEPDVPVLYDSFSIPLSSSTLHRSPFENFGPTPGVPPLFLAPFPPPTHPSLPPPFATPRNNLKAH